MSDWFPRRSHHQAIYTILQGLNRNILEDSACLFGGGTCIALQLGEFRESKDIDFLCSEHVGYRNLREEIYRNGLKRLLSPNKSVQREPILNQYGMRTVLAVGDYQIRFEIVLEGRIKLDSGEKTHLPVLCLSRSDLYAEKLMANADRGLDRQSASRDFIDLMLMIRHWGGIPEGAIRKSKSVYGDTIARSLEQSMQYLQDPNPGLGWQDWLEKCTRDMQISEDTTRWLFQTFRGVDGPDILARSLAMNETPFGGGKRR